MSKVKRLSGVIPSSGQAFPVGAIYLSITGVNPATELGYGVWSQVSAGRALVGYDAGDVDFNAQEKTGGAKTVASAGSVAAPTISGEVAVESSHTHSVTSNVSVADHASHTHAPGTLATSAHTGTAVADHASHTHTYTEVLNHTHPVNITDPGHTHGMQEGQTDGAGTLMDRSNAASATTTTTDSATTGITATTSNPSGGVATGTTAGPSATLTHSVTQPSAHTISGATAGPSATLTHSVTNSAVTSGAGDAHKHTSGTLAASAPAFTGSPTSVVQPYYTVSVWKRTA